MENHDLKVYAGLQIIIDWARENLKQNAYPVLLISVNEYGSPVILSNIPKETVIQLTGKIHDELIKNENIVTFKKY
ncbi:MAG TPA: hypothetical protein VNX01_16385 [Bacteroidia bacterium]|jgi:hypothetical protein|nr:hypothetical protein [Bacteroidia bacterium]